MCLFNDNIAMNKFRLILFIVAISTLSVPFNINAQNLISQFERTVTFFYTKNNKQNLQAQGTGFLMFIPASDTTKRYIYLITAKHVLLDTNDSPLNLIYAKFNTKDSTELLKVTLKWSGSEKTVFIHPDSTVDLAIIPVIMPQRLDFTLIPAKDLIYKSEYDSLGINVGTDVFFTGLFTAFTGNKSIYPIFRFGKICLIPRERIEFNGELKDLVLLETSSFGGNSGSPVIFKYINPSNKRTTVKTAGVLIGGFERKRLIARDKFTNKEIFDTNSIGISAIVPADYIHEILYGAELSSKRSK